MATWENFVQTSTNAELLVGGTSVVLNAAVAPWRVPAAPNGDTCYLTLTDSLTNPTVFEVISYTGRTGTGPYTLTGLTRGLEGTQAAEWPAGSYVMQYQVASQIVGPADIAAGLADGDKGDITVSDSGAAWTLNTGVVDATKLDAAVVSDLAEGTAAYAWGDHAGLYDSLGSAAAAVGFHEGASNPHPQYLQTESDPVFSAWDKSTGISITESQISDFGSYEPAFAKNTAFNKNFGTAAGTVAQGNDSRIANGQTAYSWGDHAGLYDLAGTAASAVSAHEAEGDPHPAYQLEATLQAQVSANSDVAANTAARHSHANKAILDATTAAFTTALAAKVDRIDFAIVTGSADSNVSCVVNTHYRLDISGFTADRLLVIPSGSVGDEIFVELETGDDAYVLDVLGNVGVTLLFADQTKTNAVITSLVNTGDKIRARCVAANTWLLSADFALGRARLKGDQTNDQYVISPATFEEVGNTVADYATGFAVVEGDPATPVASRVIALRRCKVLISALIHFGGANGLSNQVRLYTGNYASGGVAPLNFTFVTSNPSPNQPVSYPPAVVILEKGHSVWLEVQSTSTASRIPKWANMNTMIVTEVAL